MNPALSGLYRVVKQVVGGKVGIAKIASPISFQILLSLCLRDRNEILITQRNYLKADGREWMQ